MLAPHNVHTLQTIGFVNSPLVQKFGLPRQSGLAKHPTQLVFHAPYHNADAFRGLNGFSHLWVLWLFHHNKDCVFRPLIRPPRLGGNQKMGVFASRSMYRPNAIGLSVVAIQHIKHTAEHTIITVIGADMMNGTPIIDIKPYIQFADSVPQASSSYAQQQPDRLDIQFTATAMQQAQQHLSLAQQQHIIELLALDPRPAYQDDDTKLYGMHYAPFNILFKVSPDNTLTVQQIQLIAKA